ncbi:MAG: hypothetical protein QM648_00520 [Solirubrobacterales bacterium]
MLFAESFFTPYYFLAVGFGAFAVIVSVIGMKKPNDFPGRFSGLIMLAGVLLGVATFVFVWRGGEKEVDHRNHESKSDEGASLTPLAPPAGVKYVG